MRHSVIAFAVFGAVIGPTACGDGPTGSDLFGSGGRGATSGVIDSGGSRSNVAGSLSLSGSGGSYSGDTSGSGGGTKGDEPPPASGPGGTTADESGGTEAGGMTSGGSSLGGSSPGGSSPSGSSSGGADGGSSSAGKSSWAGASSGGVSAGGAGGAGGGSGGASAGTGGKMDARQCVELRSKADALLAQAQLCTPSLKTACSGFVHDECGCPVAVNDPESAAAEQYLTSIEQLRARCTAACLAVACQTPSQAECTSARPGEPHCVSQGTVPVTPGL